MPQRKTPIPTDSKDFHFHSLVRSSQQPLNVAESTIGTVRSFKTTRMSDGCWCYIETRLNLVHVDISKNGWPVSLTIHLWLYHQCSFDIFITVEGRECKAAMTITP